MSAAQATATPKRDASDVSPLRLWMMRAVYLLMAIGLGLTIWPLIFDHSPQTAHMTGVAFALLGTIGLLSLLGLRYPVQMIPLLLFELTWKIIWLSAFALPSWLNDSLTEAMRSTVYETSLGAIVLIVIPWRYVYANYVRARGDPWRLFAPRRSLD